MKFSFSATAGDCRADRNPTTFVANPADRKTSLTAKWLEAQKIFVYTMVLFLIMALARTIYAYVFPIPVGFNNIRYNLAISAILLSISIYMSTRFRPSRLPLLLNCLSLSVIGYIGLKYMATVCFFVGRSWPYIDVQLSDADKFIGFDYLAYLHFVDAHAWTAGILNAAYTSIWWQPVIVILSLAAVNDERRAYAFLTAKMLGITIVSVIAIFTPALGTLSYYGVTSLDHPHIAFDLVSPWVGPVTWLRAASFRTPFIYPLAGLITFPSFHAAAAVICAWGAWRVPLLRWLAIGWNAVMLAATPIFGGHYLVDVIAGVFIALAVIALVAWAFSTNTKVVPVRTIGQRATTAA